MGLVSSGATVTVQAFLTAAGRKKLFDSLETVNEPFVTKFAVGDSDTNYASIEAGYGPLLTGHVPQPGEWKPRIRSFLLAEGSYKPSVAHIVVDGRYGGSEGHYRTFPIGSNTPAQQTFVVETEWPKGTKYPEQYKIEYNLAGISAGLRDLALFSDLFNITIENNSITIAFRGGADQTILDNIIGPDNETNNGWTITLRLEGLESQQVTVLSIDFVQ